MPTYDYECRKCGHTFEAFQGITEEPLTKCPECKGTVKRLIGGGLGVIFKGSGFYSTDNKRGSSTVGINGSASKSKDSDTAKTDAPKTDTAKKPDAPSPAPAKGKD